MTTTETQRDALLAQWAQIKTGAVIFKKHPRDGWLIWGQATTLTPGAVVHVAKRDGTTEDVIVDQRFEVNSRDGIEHAMATFTRPRRAETSPATRPVVHTNVTDRTAASVGRLIGKTSTHTRGLCHYCSQPLDARGYCQECV